MALIGFVVLAALVLVVSFAFMAALQRHMDLEPSWYGLMVLGSATVVASWLVVMGVLSVHSALFLPEQMSESALRTRYDVVFILTFLLGVSLEAFKSYAVKVFDTRFNRGDWTLYGLAVGAGAGLIQAMWYLGSRVWTVLAGLDEVGASDWWLVLRCALVIVMEAVLAAVVMYQTARDNRWEAVWWFGAAHGLVLMLPTFVALVPGMETSHMWTGSGFAALVTAGAGLLLWRWVKIQGWPT